MDTTYHRATTPLGELAYTDVGDGPPAVFVHGVFLNGRVWDGVVEGLRDVRRCIAVDLPGHGASPMADDQDMSLPGLADLLAAACDAIGLDAVDLVANDSGGAVAQVFAARHPQRLRSLVLTNCDVHTNLPPERFAPIVELARAGQLAALVGPLLADPALARAEGALGDGFEHPEAVGDDVIRAFTDPIAGDPDGPRKLERFLTDVVAEDLVAVEPQLKALEVPTLIVWGTGDEFFGLEWARWLHDTIPGARDVVEVPGAKLFFPLERPADVVAPVRRFWGVG